MLELIWNNLHTEAMCLDYFVKMEENILEEKKRNIFSFPQNVSQSLFFFRVINTLELKSTFHLFY